MRNDMFKVIVNRPRIYGDWDTPGKRPREPADAQPLREGMRSKRTSDYKMQSDHLQPLRRFLQSQAGRPWSLVYSDISKNLRSTHAVQQHLREHLTDFVAIRVIEKDGRMFAADQRNYAGRLVPLERASQELWVDPRTGILRDNRHRIAAQKRRKEGRRREARERDQRLVIASDTLQYHRLRDGAWWSVEIAPAAGWDPAAVPERFAISLSPRRYP